MKLGRIRAGGEVHAVRFEGGRAIAADGRAFDAFDFEVPCVPTKIIGIARNYRAHAAELGNAVPEEEPLFFFKPPSALLAHGGVVRLPAGRGRVDYEGELGVVIGRRAKDVSIAEARAHVLGYTCVFDVTARAAQKALGHFSLAKGFDGFCPVGPWIETELSPEDLHLVTEHNGERVQDGRTSQMVHGVDRLIAFLSSVMSLEPGDLIATGTPAGVRPLAGGDALDLSIEGIGTLHVEVMG